jgi:hypothetical protein
MKLYLRLLFLFAAFGIPFFGSGCATTGTTTPVTTTTGTVAVPTQTVNIGYEIENYLQEFNTGVSAALPTVDSFLAATHNTKDATTVNMYASLASLAATVVQAGLAAGLPPQQVQAQVNAALVPTNAAAVAAAATTPSTSMHWIHSPHGYEYVSNELWQPASRLE